MSGEHDEPESAVPDRVLPDRVLRGAVALLGVGALVVAAFVLVAVGSFLMREPQTQAEAHAMTHSVPGVIVALVFGVGGFGLAGVILLAVAYVNRRHFSAGTLVAAGLLGLVVLGDRLPEPLVAAALTAVILGGYALYEDASVRGPLAFVAGATALLWFVEILQVVGFFLGVPYVVSQFLPYRLVWARRLLGVGALGILGVAAWYHKRGRSVPRSALVLAAALLVSFLPGAVWAALSQYRVAGFSPLGWAQLAVATAAAAAVLARLFGRPARTPG